MARLFACFGISVVLVACGSSDSSSVSPGGDAGVGGDAGAGGDANARAESGSDGSPAGGDDAGSQDGGGAAPDSGGGAFDGQSTEAGGAYFGKVLFELFYQYNGLPGVPETAADSLIVKFAPAADLPSVLACNAGSVTSGACCFERATPADGGVSDEVSAGDLTLKDNGDPLTMLTFGAQGYDAGNATLAMGWNPGDLLQATAAGATVGAFSGQTAAPQKVALQSITTTVSVGADWTVNWAPATLPGPHMIADLVASEGQVKCIADDSSGSIVFPKSLLANFNSTEKAVLGIARTVVSDVSPPDATVEIGALTGESVNVQFSP